MTVIRQQDLIASVAGALQYISYYHPVDYIRSLTEAYEREQSPAAGRHSADSHQQPHVCRPPAHLPGTGIVTVFLKVGMDVRFDGQRQPRGNDQ